MRSTSLERCACAWDRLPFREDAWKFSIRRAARWMVLSVTAFSLIGRGLSPSLIACLFGTAAGDPLRPRLRFGQDLGAIPGKGFPHLEVPARLNLQVLPFRGDGGSQLTSGRE